MIMKKTKLLIYLFCLFACYYVSSCTKMNDYKQYVKEGPIRYTGKVDSIIVHPGNNRIVLTMILGSDPSITKIRVYWNNRTDSMERNIKRKSSGKDTVSMSIDNLQERIYNFSVFTYDDKGHSSVVTNASGEAYGSNYLSAVSNRMLESVTQSVYGGTVILKWSVSSKGEIGTELKYIDDEGKEQRMIVSPDSIVTHLSNYKENSTLLYKSLYLPDSAAIDTFSIDYSSASLPVFERQLDKANFQALNLPTDAEDCCGWHIEHLWDEDYGTPGFAARSPGIPNQWFSLDLGEETQLSRFKTWQATDRLYELQSLKRFEVWGSNAPDLNGSWENWTKLMTCESIKPSGLPAGQTTDEDVAYAKAGEEFVFPDGTPPVRYIRIKPLETWGESDWSTMSELTFWTHDH